MTQTSLASLRNIGTAAPVEVKLGFDTVQGFEGLQRVGTLFSHSELVPKRFQGKEGIANCCIAVEMAMRMGASPLMVAQNLYVVHGTPSWSSAFLIACFNQSGRFTPITYKFEGERGTDNWGCRAVTSYIGGEQIEGTLITIEMAKKEGWYGKSGSKWQTMPEQMLRYRAAAWLIRTTAPEIGMGFKTSEEVVDAYDMAQDEKGTFTITTADISEVVTPRETQVEQVEQPSQAKKVKKQCTEKEQAPAPKAPPTPQAPPASKKIVPPAHPNPASIHHIDEETGEVGTYTVSCPNKNGANVNEIDCAGCPSRQGCPSW